jgi:hypothetical protein
MKHVKTLKEKYTLGTGITRLTTNRKINKMGMAGLHPVSFPSNEIQMINKITGTTSRI